MGLFRRSRPEWNPNDIPDLSFDGPTHFVDIGSLGGDDHRKAFADIFRKMLADNQGALRGLDLVTIEARRAVISSLELPARLLELDPDRLAGELYDSENEKLYLRLRGADSQATLGMTFDDPSFWLEEVGA